MQDELFERIETGLSGKPVEVRYFKNEEVQSAINRALEGISGDERAVMVHLEANQTNLNAALVAKLDGKWSIAWGYARGDWGWATGTAVKFAW